MKGELQTIELEALFWGLPEKEIANQSSARIRAAVYITGIITFYSCCCNQASANVFHHIAMIYWKHVGLNKI